MNIQEQLDPILEKWNLLKHPFYRAWSAGTLPVEALKVYAGEYGTFIETLADGWSTLKDPGTAHEEKEHAELWNQFASALDTKVDTPQIAATRDLIDTAHKLFANPASTLGAMYAFEAQQPATAKSKLDGLRTHYVLPAEVEPYFEVHSANWHETEKILSALEALSPLEQTLARDACTEMAESLWNALTGIHEATCAD